MVTCNTTSETSAIVEDPLFAHITFHHVGLIISAVFSLVSVIIAFFLMQKHATHYSKPGEQRHIIRIILMLPVYSVVSFLSYLFYQHSVYFEVIRDCYEAFAISSFFTLLCNYIAPTLHDQKDYFRQLTPKNWALKVFWMQKCTGGEDKGILRRPRSGLTWFNVVWIGIFQYCFIRVFFTIVSVATQATGRYCEESLNPAFAHIWTMVFEGAAVTVAMYFVIQFYIQLKDDLADHKPFLKVVCIKMVIFFSFWQSLLISFLTSAGAIKASKKLASQDIKIGIPSLLLCIEMAIFAVMHLFAFPWREYDMTSQLYADPMGGAKQPQYYGGKFGFKAWLDAFNLWDIIKAFARGCRWLFVGRKHRHSDISYQPNAAGILDQPQTSKTATDDMPSDTELQGRGRSDTVDLPFDDRAGLLSHAQNTALSQSVSRDDDGYNEHELDYNMNPTAVPGGVGAGAGGYVQPVVVYPGANPYTGSYPPAPGAPATWNTSGGYYVSPAAAPAPAPYGGYVMQPPPPQGQPGGPPPQWHNHWAGPHPGEQ